MAYLRIFSSAIDPADREEVERLFREDVRPTFLGMPGCMGIDLAISVEPNAGGLVDGAAISRWESLEHMNQAVDAPEAQESLGRIGNLLRHSPAIRVFEVLP